MPQVTEKLLRDCLEIINADRLSCWDGDKHPKGPIQLELERILAEGK